MEFFIILIGFIVFDLAAIRWGIDSSDGINSREWQRRYNWALRMVGSNRAHICQPHHTHYTKASHPACSRKCDAQYVLEGMMQSSAPTMQIVCIAEALLCCGAVNTSALRTMCFCEDRSIIIVLTVQDCSRQLFPRFVVCSYIGMAAMRMQILQTKILVGFYM